jgi:hypothetical protein
VQRGSEGTVQEGGPSGLLQVTYSFPRSSLSNADKHKIQRPFLPKPFAVVLTNTVKAPHAVVSRKTKR